MEAVGSVEYVYTDANSSYSKRFSEIGVTHLHRVETGKSQMHLIESVNSSIRDNLARFNRRSKRL